MCWVVHCWGQLGTLPVRVLSPRLPDAPPVDTLWGSPVVLWPAGSMAIFPPEEVLGPLWPLPVPPPLGLHRCHHDAFISRGPGAQAGVCGRALGPADGLCGREASRS